LGVAAEVPLAPHARRVPLLRQNLRDRAFPARQAVGATADRDGLGSGPDRVAPGQERRTARRALRLGVEVQQAQAFAGERVDAGRRRAAQDAAAVAAELTPPEVVPQEDDDVWLLRTHASAFRWLRSSRVRCLLHRDQLEPELLDALEEAVELRLVAHP